MSVIGFGWPARLYAPLPYVQQPRPAYGAVVPAGATAQIVVVLTVHGSAAYASGEDVIYTSQGQTYIQDNPHDLLLGHQHCP